MAAAGARRGGRGGRLRGREARRSGWTATAATAEGDGEEEA